MVPRRNRASGMVKMARKSDSAVLPSNRYWDSPAGNEFPSCPAAALRMPSILLSKARFSKKKRIDFHLRLRTPIPLATGLLVNRVSSDICLAPCFELACTVRKKDLPGLEPSKGLEPRGHTPGVAIRGEVLASREDSKQRREIHE